MSNSTNGSYETIGTNGTNGTNGNGDTGSGLGLTRVLTTEDIVADVFYCILAAAIIFGNSLVIGAFRVNRRLRSTTNLLLLSLAVADMLIGLISIPMFVYMSITFDYMGIVSEIFLTFDVICGVSSILNLAAISLERCYALLRPIRHRNIGKGVVLAAICVVWLLSILAATLKRMPLPNIDLSYGTVMTLIFFFLPLAIILISYGVIFHIARAHVRGRGVRSFKKELRIATTVAVVIGLFIVCWTPFFATNFHLSICKITKEKSPGCPAKLPLFFFSLSKWLQYGNSVCNPIVYGLRNKDFRIAFRKILLGLCGKSVPLTSFSKSVYGRTVRSANVRHHSSFEDSQSVLHPPNAPARMFDARESYRRAIQNGRIKPIKMKFKKKTLAAGLLTLNVQTFHSLPPKDGTSPTDLLNSTSSPTSEVTSGELSNPGFDDDSAEETGIYPSDQALAKKEPSVNLESLRKKTGNRSTENEITRVRFADPNEPGGSESTIDGHLAGAFERKRSSSEQFRRSRGDPESLKQELRSSFS